jgi:CDP-diacylglycerol--glycerol-3-phosphate 3-phosphatidyltransferase
MDRLQRQWAILAAACSALALGAAGALTASGGLGAAMRGALPAALVLAGILWQLRRHLNRNHPPGDPRLRPALGAANLVTISRAVLTASLTGFLFQAPIIGAGAFWEWLPGFVYLCAVALDYADGHVARRTNNITALGAYLDTQIDALGLLLAVLLLVWSAKAPLPYLWVGIGYYVLRIAVHLRRVAGYSVHHIPPRPDARWIAGCAMTTTALALLPVFKPEATRPAAWIMTLAMALSLGRDWFIICGRGAGGGSDLTVARNGVGRRLARHAPLIVRLALAASLGLTVWATPPERLAEIPLLVRAGVLAGTALCVGGVVVRGAAMLLSLLWALWLAPNLPAGTATIALMAALMLVFAGAGRPRRRQPQGRGWADQRDADTLRPFPP